jgi:spore germination protein KA
MTNSSDVMNRLKSALLRMDDCIFKEMTIAVSGHEQSFTLIYSQSICPTWNVLQFVTSERLLMVTNAANERGSHSSQQHNMTLIRGQSSSNELITQVTQHILSGQLIIYHMNQDCFFAIPLGQLPKRQTSESNMEVSVRGPRDGFVEDIDVNVALIRKRIQSTDLKCEKYIIGSITQTKVALVYMEGIIQENVLANVRNRIEQTQMQSLTSNNQFESRLHGRSLFPLFQYSGRPDYTAEALLDGKFVILVDGNPSVSIAPNSLSMIIKSAEDMYFTSISFTFIGISLRIFGFFIAVFLPGLWASLVGYHHEQIPFPLLATITVSRTGLPLSAIMELFLILLLFEMFREAGLRLPKNIGQTLTVVGGIIIGEAAIRAGLLSPILLVIASSTAVASFTLSNQELLSVTSVLRIFVLLLSSILGFFGFFIGLYVTLTYLSSLKSFGVHVMTPWSKVRITGLIPKFLKTKNS